MLGVPEGASEGTELRNQDYTLNPLVECSIHSAPTGTAHDPSLPTKEKLVMWWD